jgi:hypothetical protein
MAGDTCIHHCIHADVRIPMHATAIHRRDALTTRKTDQVVEKAPKSAHPGQFKAITTLGVGCDDGWSDCCNECGTGGELLCCDQCPRTYCLDCARLDKIPRGRWNCRPCRNAQQMLLTGGGIGSEKLLMQVVRLSRPSPFSFQPFSTCEMISIPFPWRTSCPKPKP